MSVQMETCYSCSKEEKIDDVLLKPCSNSTCTAKIHESCFRTKLDNDESNCGVCKSYIDLNRFRTFNLRKFLRDSWYFFSSLLGIIIFMVMLLGQDLFTGECSVDNHNGTGIHSCLFSEILTSILFGLCSLLMLIFLLGRHKSGDDESRKFSHKIIRWLIPIVIVFMIFCQTIGFGVSILYYGDYTFYTHSTALIGIIFICVIIILIFVGCCIYSFYKEIRKKYSNYRPQII